KALGAWAILALASSDAAFRAHVAARLSEWEHQGPNDGLVRAIYSRSRLGYTVVLCRVRTRPVPSRCWVSSRTRAVCWLARAPPTKAKAAASDRAIKHSSAASASAPATLRGRRRRLGRPGRTRGAGARCPVVRRGRLPAQSRPGRGAACIRRPRRSRMRLPPSLSTAWTGAARVGRRDPAHLGARLRATHRTLSGHASSRAAVAGGDGGAVDRRLRAAS